MVLLLDIVDEIQKGMLVECDFYKEVVNIDDFYKFLEEIGNIQVIVLKVFKQVFIMWVLIMECFYGVFFMDFDSVWYIMFNLEVLLIIVMNIWFFSLLFCEFFYVDVYVGNLLVLKDGCIGFIDFGIVGWVKFSIWEFVFKFIWVIGQEDYDEMVVVMLGIGMMDEEVDVEKLVKDIEKFYFSMDRVMLDLDLNVGDMVFISEYEVNKVMMDLVGIGKCYGIYFLCEFVLLLKQLLYFDCYVCLLVMDVNIYMDECLNFILDMDWKCIY